MPQKFSVIIPAYNQAAFLGEAVQSVLNQTYQDFEVLVVNDASTDETASVIAQFLDSRVVCINHSINRGGSAARNTGVSAAKGDFIAHLDADDYFHPEKLAAHYRLLNTHPDVSITYNARYQLHHSTTKIRDIYRPPDTVQLKDIVLGYPFSPSDMVLRRNVVEQNILFNEEYRNLSEDFEYYTRLAEAGFRFARVPGVLNYRRYYAGRRHKNLEAKIQKNVETLERVFSNSACPAHVLVLRKRAYINYFTEVTYMAYGQGDYELGRKFIQEMLHIAPEIADEKPAKVVTAIFNYIINDDSLEHEKRLPEVFSCLPPELALSSEEAEGYISRAYLLKGTRSALWDDPEKASFYFRRAGELKARLDEPYRAQLAAQLAGYEAELGREAVELQAQRLYPYLERMAGKESVRQIRGLLAFNRAFAGYRVGKYQLALREVIRAVAAQPRYLANRGALSIAVRSLLKR